MLEQELSKDERPRVVPHLRPLLPAPLPATALGRAPVAPRASTTVPFAAAAAAAAALRWVARGRLEFRVAEEAGVLVGAGALPDPVLAHGRHQHVAGGTRDGLRAGRVDEGRRPLRAPGRVRPKRRADLDGGEALAARGRLLRHPVLEIKRRRGRGRGRGALSSGGRGRGLGSRGRGGRWHRHALARQRCHDLGSPPCPTDHSTVFSTDPR